MANTTIQLKKSATPLATPADLANGEIAINYADGKLFYKDSTGTIQQISGGGNNFSTINAAGTLIVSDIQNDIFTLDQGDNIIITGDAVNDTITVTANLKSVYDVANAAFGAANAAGGDLTPANNWANTVAGYANNFAGTMANSVNAYTSATYSTITFTSAAFDKANSANVLAYNTGIGANAYADLVGTSANNYAGAMVNAANSYAASLTPDLSPAFNKANDAYTQANAAFDKANTSGGNSFSTINVSSQGNVTASLSNDVLKLVSGGGINITTNTSAKSITISQATTIDYGLIDGAVTAENDYGSIA